MTCAPEQPLGMRREAHLVPRHADCWEIRWPQRGGRAMADPPQYVVMLDQHICLTELLLARQRRRVLGLEARDLDARTAVAFMQTLGNTLEALRQSRDVLVSLDKVLQQVRGLDAE